MGLDAQQVGIIAEQIRDTPLETLRPVVAALAETVMVHRSADERGYVPQDIFPLILGMAGQYTCMECVLRVVRDDESVLGYMLKERTDAEQGWHGQFHVPGVTMVVTRTNLMEANQYRLEKEIDLFSPDEWQTERKKLSVVGLEAHTEPERNNTTCLTLVQLLDLRHGDPRLSKSGWRFFSIDTVESDPSVVGHHRRTLAWIGRPGRQAFEMVDLRPDLAKSEWVGVGTGHLKSPI